MADVRRKFVANSGERSNARTRTTLYQRCSLFVRTTGVQEERRDIYFRKGSYVEISIGTPDAVLGNMTDVVEKIGRGGEAVGQFSHC
ncbi:hypothetical protein GCM10009000_042380 [Halobacterium noricense]